MLHYESRHRPLLHPHQFLRRMLRSIGASAALTVFSLGAGMLGYHWTEGLNWVDSFANAAMILSGMGPLQPIQTDPGKLFAGCYALYSGLVIVLTVGVLAAPIVHRFMHRFHLEDEKDGSD